MIKLVFCASRKSEISLVDFRKRWNESHVPLLSELAQVTRAVKHVHSLTLVVERNLEIMLQRGTRRPYDAISEVWWNNAAELETGFAAERAEALRERLFTEGGEYIDHSRSTLFFTQEQE